MTPERHFVDQDRLGLFESALPEVERARVFSRDVYEDVGIEEGSSSVATPLQPLPQSPCIKSAIDDVCPAFP